jgi:3-hydroxymyristoyl/3-hydroxydecanoyl-(acyl carrier protein) dehydratase
LLPMERFIDKEDVCQQFNEIYRPGNWFDYLNSSSVEGRALVNYDALKFFVMSFDKIIQFEPGLSMTAVKSISRSAPYFHDHFPKNPVLPMTVLLECKLNLARLFLQESNVLGHYQVSELRKIKMNEFVYPGAVVYCYISVLQSNEQQLILRFRSEVENKRVCIVDVVMTAKV